MGKLLGAPRARLAPKLKGIGKYLKKLATISARYLQRQPGSKQRLQRQEMLRVKDLAITQQGVLCE